VLDDEALAALIVRLADEDPMTVADAGARLVEAGADAVPRMIVALRRASLRDRLNPRADRTTAALIKVLQNLGDAVLTPLVAAIPGAIAADRSRADLMQREMPWRIGSEAYVLEMVLRNLQISDDRKYLPLLRHPERDIRYWALRALATPPSAVSPFVEQVLPLIDDPDTAVANQVTETLVAMGFEVRARLRELGRQPSENRERVLAALAVLGEWPVLEPADQALLRQWIEDRVATETPEPMAELNGEFLGEWFAVSTGDRDALVEVLGLHQPMPVTMRIGWNLASVGEDRVYLTPELNGWTLIFCYFLPDREFATLRGFLVELSRRFGAAQYFYNDYGYQGWALAEHGELLRLYISGDSPESDEVVGPPHSAEIMASAGLLDDDESDDRPLCGAQGVAAYASLDPAQVGPDIRVRGHGLVGGMSAGWHGTLGL
jgi:hypothetical protein